MAPLTSSTEIARPAKDVFDYVTDPSRFPEWQRGVVAGGMHSGPVQVGSLCTNTRRIGGVAREVISEITEYSPPRRWAVRGVQGPIRASVAVTVESLGDEPRSRVTIALTFDGQGIGKVLVPLFVRRQARSEMPKNMRALKERLEQGARRGSASEGGAAETASGTVT